ncbi:hypothetical protein E3N88_28238 [Mikania micrantha]|uniref:Uncharacterized protein n=1 Tax=Mikania micrantha TaxID=192012 RepID=A0A5N6N041_9ASTR|nr:hypothetical protein E3N88_28238 [Mikania micrantha]
MLFQNSATKKAEFEKTGRRLGSACDDKYLRIKCKDESACEHVDVSDLESLYSLDDERGNHALCTIGYSESESSDTEDSYTSDSETTTEKLDQSNSYDLPVFMAKTLSKPPESPPIPIAKVHLITNTYAKPLPVIAFFDTRSTASFLNHDVLPEEYWKPHSQYFQAANGETFVVDKINTPVYIRLFPKCTIKHKFLGLSSHGKDLWIGFDLLHKLPDLRYGVQGLKYKSFLIHGIRSQSYTWLHP